MAGDIKALHVHDSKLGDALAALMRSQAVLLLVSTGARRYETPAALVRGGKNTAPGSRRNAQPNAERKAVYNKSLIACR